MSRIYLDHNASTPVRPEVLEAMLPYFGGHFGNASSVHAFGQEARGAIEDARAQVAALLNATPGEIVFTSGGTESDNIGVIGGARALPLKGRHVIVSAVEHDAVRHAADALERDGFTVTRVAPDARGVVAPESIAAAIRPDTALVSVMAANNETGVVQPVAEIGAICAERGVAYHVDAVQAAGKDGAPRVPNTSHLSFVGAEGEHLILSLDMKGVAVSSGAACKAGSSHPSHVLLAMGVPREVAQSAVRFSLGRCTTEQEIDRVVEVLPTVVSKLRASSPTAAS